jgi:quercetin dioxygenase-like cupin family protein
MSIFKRTSLLFSLTFGLAAGALFVQPAVAAGEPVVTELMTQPLKDMPGKEGLMLMVTYPPGGADPVHRHDAHGFIYVLEGTIVMGVKGGKEVTLKPGQTFYEGPDDIHTVGRNASKTKPAKFVVFLLKKQGAPALVPAQ